MSHRKMLLRCMLVLEVWSEDVYLGNWFHKTDSVVCSFDFGQAVTEIIPVVFSGSQKCCFLLLVELSNTITIKNSLKEVSEETFQVLSGQREISSCMIRGFEYIHMARFTLGISIRCGWSDRKWSAEMPDINMHLVWSSVVGFNQSKVSHYVTKYISLAHHTQKFKHQKNQ